jgi:hypothetical protein
VHSLQIRYGSTWGTQYGYGTGKKNTVKLSLDEVITGVYVGFAKLDYGSIGLCYLQFNSTQRSYGPYDAGCRGTVTSYYNLSSGLAYMSGMWWMVYQWTDVLSLPVTVCSANCARA